MATIADVYVAFAYIKSVYLSPKGNASQNIDFPPTVRQWLESTPQLFASVKNLTLKLTHDERRMFSMVQSVFNGSNPPSLGAGIAACVCDALLEVKDGEAIKTLLENKIASYLEKQKLAALAAKQNPIVASAPEQKTANASVVVVTSQQQLLVEENQRLKEQVVALQQKNQKNEEEVARLKAEKQNQAIEMQKLKEIAIVSQAKLEETFAVLREVIGDPENNDAEYSSLKKVLDFYNTQMKEAVKLAKQNIHAKDALIKLVLYSDSKQKEAARSARDYFRATGIIPDDINKAEALLKQFKKESKGKGQDALKIQVREKQDDDIASAKITAQLLEKFKDKLATEAGATLQELKSHNDMLLVLIEGANAEPVLDLDPVSVGSAEHDAIIASLRSEVARLEQMMIANPFPLGRQEQKFSSTATNSNDNNAPPIAPPMAPPMAPAFTGVDIPPPPPGGPSSIAIQPLNKPAAPLPPGMAGLFDAIRAKKPLKKVDPNTASANSSVSADSGSGEPSMVEALQNAFKQKLSILEKAPAEDESKAVRDEKVIFKNAGNEWIFISYNKNKTKDEINISKVPALSAVVVKLDSKKAAEFSNNDRSDILRDMSAYLRTQVKRSSGAPAAVAPVQKQNLEAFDLIAEYKMPPTYSKFTYLLSKDTTTKEWKLQFYIPEKMQPTGKKGESQPNPIVIALDDVAELRAALLPVQHKELRDIGAADLWKANQLIKKYHIALIKSGTLQLAAPEIVVASQKRGNGLFDVMQQVTQATTFQKLAAQHALRLKEADSDDEEEKSSSLGRLGKNTSEWD
jgi:hypothetical protein